jgi:translation elongation factor P/translation initiation factor 5A
MKNKELKVGHYIEIEETGQICKITAIDTEGKPIAQDVKTKKIVDIVGKAYKIISFLRVVLQLVKRYFF